MSGSGHVPGIACQTGHSLVPNFAPPSSLVTDDATAHRRGDRVYDGYPGPAAACRPVSTGVESDKGVWPLCATRIRFAMRRGHHSTISVA